VVQVADYAELRTKGQADAGERSRITVMSQYIAGAFEWSATDPYALGDDGGLVIAATDGWWVRVFSYAVDRPIDLGWYEVLDNEDVTQLLKDLITRSQTFYSVKVPDYPCTLIWNDVAVFDWTSTYPINRWYMYESSSPVTFKLMGPDTTAFWSFNPLSEFGIGSPHRKASRDDYNLTFIGTWDWDHRPIADRHSALNWVGAVGAIYIRGPDTTPNRQCFVRCNAQEFVSDFVKFHLGSTYTVAFAGKYRYGTGIQIDSAGHTIYEDFYISDEVGRKCGWNGLSDGNLIWDDWSHCRSGAAGMMTSGYVSPAGVAKLSGEVTYQYGASYGSFFLDMVGNSIDDPFLLHIKDWGISGPNKYGKPPGVSMSMNASYNNHFAKSDGFGEQTKDIPNLRFYKFIQTYDAYGLPTGPETWTRFMFIENAQGDDNPAADPTYTTDIVYICVGLIGLIWMGNGSIEGDRIEALHFMGDGNSPAFVPTANGNPHVDLALGCTAKYGQFGGVYVGDNNVTIDTITCFRKITFKNDIAGLTAQNITFLGAAREIVSIGAGTTVDLINLYAPLGSTINGAGALLIDGVTKSLPHTVVAEDLGVAVPDIPPNPLLGAA
jgi:hypothetical protein